MCRRIYIDRSFDSMAETFSFAKRDKVDDLGNRLPRYNGAPAEVYHIIIQDNERQGGESKPAFAIARWGFMPAWIDPRRHAPAIVRGDIMATHQMFREAYRSRRCLVPVSGFIEWSEGNQPHAVTLKDRSTFALAGIWEVWRHPVGIDIRTFAIATCEPNELIATIHNRMPVVLRPEHYERWLSAAPDPRDLMKPFDPVAMTMWPIARRISTRRNGGPEVLSRVDFSGKQARQRISKFR
ncbi:SOS response-associated peptidase [Rhizobium bangladeshense]|uniref:SOS response-associated peptidase n=1 Tax=Rhizobium bangladeshense TaxID=1138189 RepID=UPI0007E55881|nr:SOS response-associated peptidase [Rhizobium bangladeshense]